MYVLDRNTGQFLMGKPFTNVNWMSGFDEKGRPMRVPGKVPTPEGSTIMPTVLGGTNWYPPSYSPRTGWFYIPMWANTGTIAVEGGRPKATGNTPMGAVNLQTNLKLEKEGYGAVAAFDPKTGERKWEFKMNDVTWAGRADNRYRIFCSAADAKATSTPWMTALASCCGRPRSAGRSTAGR